MITRSWERVGQYVYHHLSIQYTVVVISYAIFMSSTFYISIDNCAYLASILVEPLAPKYTAQQTGEQTYVAGTIKHAMFRQTFDKPASRPAQPDPCQREPN
jgi:hypothetical protein